MQNEIKDLRRLEVQVHHLPHPLGQLAGQQQQKGHCLGSELESYQAQRVEVLAVMLPVDEKRVSR